MEKELQGRLDTLLNSDMRIQAAIYLNKVLLRALKIYSFLGLRNNFSYLGIEYELDDSQF